MVKMFGNVYIVKKTIFNQYKQITFKGLYNFMFKLLCDLG